MIRDIVHFFRALASNQLARLAPSFYVVLTKQTGRGSGFESIETAQAYFQTCFCDYTKIMGIPVDSIGEFLAGKKILEYGPGDVLGNALLFFAHGAEKVDCIDRFPLARFTERHNGIYSAILASLPEKLRERAENAFVNSRNLSRGFRPELISYKIESQGITQSPHKYDLILSRAVLEHVSDLSGTFKNIKSSLKQDGLTVHLVDLKSHGLDHRREFDFLSWNPWVYSLMYSHKGFPNRLRIDAYKREVERNNFQIIKLEPTEQMDMASVQRIRPYLAKCFSHISDEELSWKAFWMILKHKQGNRLGTEIPAVRRRIC